MGPAINWASGLLGRLTGYRQDQSYLFGGERTRRTTTWGVAENVFDRATQHGLAFATFNGDQSSERLLPTPSPEADLFSRQADFIGDVCIE